MKTIDHEQQLRITGKFLDTLSSPLDLPILYAMVGIPASGKTTFLTDQKKKGALPQSYYSHDPDKVMETLPGYQSDLKAMGAEAAKKRWEMPVREFVDNTLFPKAISSRFNIVMDMGLCRSQIIQMIQECKTSGYQVRMHFIYCDLPVAIQRSRQRNRHVSHKDISIRASFLSENITSILSMADSANIWNNSDLTNPYRPLSLKQALARINKSYGLCSTG